MLWKYKLQKNCLCRGVLSTSGFTSQSPGDLLHTAAFYLHVWSTESQSLGVGSRNLPFPEASPRFRCTAGLGNHYARLPFVVSQCLKILWMKNIVFLQWRFLQMIVAQLITMEGIQSVIYLFGEEIKSLRDIFRRHCM